MNTVTTFTNETLGTVRVVKKDGVEWFVAKDVCDILEISNNRDALARLDEDEKMTVGLTDSHSGQRGGAQQIGVVNEYGLWQLVLGSRKPQAKEFKRWLTHEVIPAIRKNGGYIDGQEHISSDVKAKLDAEIRELKAMVNDYRYQAQYQQEKIDSLVRIIEKDTTGDFVKPKAKRDSWSDADVYDLDVEGYDQFQSDMELFNFSDYSLMEEIKAIVASAKNRYIDKAAANYLVGEINRLFVARNA
jgi:prophage antirepressor-like protein